MKSFGPRRAVKLLTALCVGCVPVQARLRGAAVVSHGLRGPPVSAADLSEDMGAEGLRFDDGSGVSASVAPEDQLTPGVEAQVGDGVLPPDYRDNLNYMPQSQDNAYPFPDPYPVRTEVWSPLNWTKNQALNVQQPMSLEDNLITRQQKLECMTSPYAWQDNRGFDCFHYHNSGWCQEDGSSGPGWTVGGGGAATPAAFANGGIDALQACCQCGGGYKSVVAAMRVNPLGDRRLIAPLDRLPDSRLAEGRVTIPGQRFANDPVHPWRQLQAPGDEYKGIMPPVAPFDKVANHYAKYFDETYIKEQLPDPMGLTARYYSALPTDE